MCHTRGSLPIGGDSERYNLADLVKPHLRLPAAYVASRIEACECSEKVVIYLYAGSTSVSNQDGWRGRVSFRP